MKHLATVLGVVLFLALLTAGCGGETAGVGTTVPEDRGPTPPTPTSPPSTDFRIVTLEAYDELTLVAAYYPPPASPAPAVLLLHALGGQKEDWAPFATQLQQAGYAVMALDLRGHGASGGEADWSLALDDVARSLAVLLAQPEVDQGRAAVMGENIGANLALVAGAYDPAVQAVVLLSAGLSDQGIRTEEAIVAYGERPVLIAAGRDDDYGFTAAQQLAELAQGSDTLTLFPGGSRGVDLLAEHPDLGNLVLAWLDVNLP